MGCVFPKRGEPTLLTSFVGHLATGREISAVTFERGETIVIEPNPCTPDLKSGVFLGDLCVVTENGAESLHTYPIDKPIVVEGF